MSVMCVTLSFRELSFKSYIQEIAVFDFIVYHKKNSHLLTKDTLSIVFQY